ncbi:MAG: 3-deoxy-8-phosphooctulonate synthase [bacterium]|nr:3-deoxy-8-phosphooctulonate synthase [bacterium]
MNQGLTIGNVRIGGGAPLAFIAGPCVIESRTLTLEIAEALAATARSLGVGLIFKASFDKANRTSVKGFRGLGPRKGLAILAEVRQRTNLPVLTDIHLPQQARVAAEVADVLQIPAFLCRQTDLLIAAGKTGKAVNIKKGQFMAPRDMQQAVEKVQATGNQRVMLTERGTTFGYNNLVVDMRSLALMRAIGVPVVFDATHSVQLPGGQGCASGGERQFVPVLARAAVAAGVDAVFMEVHPDPDRALCDGPNSWPLDQFTHLARQLCALDRIVHSTS